MNSCQKNCDLCKRCTLRRHRQAPDHEPTLFDARTARADLFDRGFTHFAVSSAGLQEELVALKAFCETLPADAKDPKGTRRRGYQKFVLLPRSRCLQVLDSSTYQQDATFNDEASGEPRQFANLMKVAGNKFLKTYILELFEALPVADSYRDRTWDVGVHLIRLRVVPGEKAVASPNRLHRDGEPFTVIHVLDRRNIVGGDTQVALDPDGKELLANFQLAPDAAVIVRDAAVWHHVTTVEAADEGVGFRDVMLVEFTPFRQDFRPLALAR